jgi:lipopolysaccharide export system protein LptA
MKRLLFLLLAGGCSLIWAQTNAPTQTNAPSLAAKASQQTEVDSDNAEFDMGGAHSPRQVFYNGNVRVTDPKIKLWCEGLTLDLPPGSGHVSHITAVTNVVIDFIADTGEKYHVTSDKAVYDYAVVNQVTNETVTWTGNPIVTTKDGKILSDPLIWDRRANRFYFPHKPTFILPEGLSGGGTNNSGFKLY